jgi:hypothetical protein
VQECNVEEIDGIRVVRVHVLKAATPREAAANATGQSVTLRVGNIRWVRVVEVNCGAEYGFEILSS